MTRSLSVVCALTIFTASVSAAGENAVTHVVKKGAVIGVKTLRAYNDDWPHVEVHVKPDNKTVKFDGSRSWKMSGRSEYSGWVLQVPEDPRKVPEVLRQEHYWMGSLVVGRRVDTRVRGHYYCAGKGGKGGRGGKGNAVAGKLPIWTVLSLDCDIDVDSNRDGEVEEDNYTNAADDEDEIEFADSNPLGAICSMKDRSKLIIRRLMPQPQTPSDGKALKDLITGSLHLVPVNTGQNKGGVRLVYETTSGLKSAIGANYALVPDLWRELLEGRDVTIEMQGSRTGRAELMALLAIKANDGSGLYENFLDKVRITVMKADLHIWDGGSDLDNGETNAVSPGARVPRPNPLSKTDEKERGAYILVNWDDDDDDGRFAQGQSKWKDPVPDLAELPGSSSSTVTIKNEDNLARLNMILEPLPRTGYAELKISRPLTARRQRLSLWTAATKGTQVGMKSTALNGSIRYKQWDLSKDAQRREFAALCRNGLWLEGVYPSSYEGPHRNLWVIL